MPPHTTALVLSGGLSLGAYHAGAYAALDGAGGPMPDHIAGCSIGAVTAAVLAGSAPEGRVHALRRLWDALTDALPDLPGAPFFLARALTWSAAARTGLFGRPGLFRPRMNLPSDPHPGLYDLSPLHRFLADTVDFDRLNGGEVRVSIAATDLVSGERVVFDTARGDRIGPEHVTASCALAPLFAPLEVGGRLLGDGGLSANTPLDLVLDDPPPGGSRGDVLVIASDLYPRAGGRPEGLLGVVARAGDLVFGNQTELLLDRYRREHALRTRIAELGGEAVPGTTVLLLGYRPAPEVAGVQKGFDYAARALAAHWAAGERDLHAVLADARVVPGGFEVRGAS